MLMADGVSVALASASAARRRLLEAAGLKFDVLASNVDEDSVRAALVDVDAVDVAEVLARAKAEDVARRINAEVVMGFWGEPVGNDIWAFETLPEFKRISIQSGSSSS